MKKNIRSVLVSFFLFVLVGNALAKEYSGDFSYSKTTTSSGFSKEYELLIASTVGDVDTVKKLLRSKVNPNILPPQDECEYYAREDINHDEFDSPGAPVNAVTKKYRTALLSAAAKGSAEIVDYLLKNKADVSICDEDGFSPLIYAAQNNNLDALKLLIANKADVNHITNNKVTPLINAAANGSLECVKELIKAGADVNYKGIAGQTPLMQACIFNYVDEAKVLLSNGADVNIKADSGYTAFDMAVNRGYDDIAALLRR